MRCRTARRWITSDLAGELSPARAGRLAQHVERCEGCRRERGAYAALDRALAALPPEAELPPRLEQDTLRRVRLAAADEPPAAGMWRWRWLRVAAPALAAAAVLLLAVRGTESPVEPSHGQPPTVSGAPHRPAAIPPAPRTARRRRGAEPVPSIPTDPPPELAARPDLFINLPVLRNMEKLQHYEAIETTTLDGQDDQSNG